MPTFDLLHLLSWIHFAALGAALGGAVAALLISGLESEQTEFHGLSAALWAKQVRWAFRIAVLIGIIMLFVTAKGSCPVRAPHFHLKLPLSILALVCAELAPKSLAAHKRGAALLALLLMLLAGFVTINKGAFKGKSRSESESRPSVSSNN